MKHRQGEFSAPLRAVERLKPRRAALAATAFLSLAALALLVLAVGLLGAAQPDVEAAHDPVTKQPPAKTSAST